MIKRKAAYALVGGLLVTGLVFNAPSMATYVQNLGTATQTINAATWNVEFGNNLREHTILPGDTVSDDTITLTNKNNYPVKYTIELTNKGDAAFNNALSLTVTDGTNSYTDKSGKGEVIVGAGETITLNSNVKWNATGNDTIHAGKQVKYNYNIVAEKEKEEVEAPEIEPALTRAWAYRNNASDTSVHVTIQTAADLDLSTGSSDNIQIHYYKEDATSKVASRSKLNDGYLNKNSVKYPQGLVNKSDYSNDAKAGEYTSTLKKTFIEPADQVKYIQVIVTKDGRTYDSGLQEVQVRDR